MDALLGVGWYYGGQAAELVSLETAEGRALLEQAEARSDYDRLSGTFVSQDLVSYCGVASSVSVLNALGLDTDQDEFFTPQASRVRSRYRVTFGGMSLIDRSNCFKEPGNEPDRCCH